jgi:predicted kinase
MKELILLRGLPGAGKTTLAKTLNAIVIEADQYFYDIDGNYMFDSLNLNNAHQYCKAQTRAWMEIKTDQVNTSRIVVSNTFTTEKEMEPYYEMAEKYDYQVVSLIVENRHGNKSVHNVPDETIEKMRNRFNIKL